MQEQTNQILLEISAKLDNIYKAMQMIVDCIVPEPHPSMFNLIGVQEQVYTLCDGIIKINAIAEAIGKEPADVRKALTRLKGKGLVRPTAGARSGIYVRTPVFWTRSVNQKENNQIQEKQ